MIKEYIIKIDEDQSKKDIHGGYPLIEPLLELVRCNDCKHGETCNEGVFCTRDIGTIESSVHKPDWYCADGQRKEGR